MSAVPTLKTTPAPTAPPESTTQHGNKAHTDGRFGYVPVQTRSDRFKSVNVADFDAVTGREAVWKLSPVAKFTDLTAGELDGSVYPISSDPVDGVTVDWVDRSDARIGTAGTPEERAAANAWSTFEKALAITVSGEEAKEITVTRADLGASPRAAHVIIEAKPFSQATVILQNTGDARLSENVEIILGESSNLTVVSVQEWNTGAVHLTNHFASVGKDARLKHVVVSLGGSIVRVNPSVRLAGSGSDTLLLGLYFADAGQHLEQQVYVFHDAPHSRSRVTYKGALQGQDARTVWIGDVLIGNKAAGTDSYEQNRNLVLSEGTRADSIPNLEIETGDIVGAGHASATGRFDDEQLFYLQSRGITEEEARRLVVRGFLTEVIQQIGSPTLEARLQETIEAELLSSASLPAAVEAR
ncbi:Fe-S cluster assembly protein SufD [Cryobacterium melibiosiphilum]|uniref:Fe-S cluster assembly protein SufD n=1 Tax=Cryobacterium melibiosiphilum TaxID=995039 RepID=A0A3A5MAL2_9MICO|nr:Fe-S cluster assembly protein SufD [Cryobacterium melibiosiphilum]RJT87160.1 Fe-S cluster assembly protein SufD [Cryobacterium melibiosiphilum]